MAGYVTKRAKKLLKSDVTTTSLNIRRGKLVRQVTFGTIKFLAMMCVTFFVINLLVSFKLFASAIATKNHLGAFINMISSGDGNILPSLQALPVFFFIIVDVALIYFTFKLFDTEKQAKLNSILFIIIMVGLSLICIILILLIVIIKHIYGAHEGLHNGIVDAMKNYSSNSLYKKHIDRLQIEFQCCGSKKYDEWYNIAWYDDSLAKKKASGNNSKENTPFSCCSMSSLFPCIHHNIESTGTAYLYTPELNLSISLQGCYSRIREKKQEVGWGIVGDLLLYIALQGLLLIFLRFIQTGHCENSKFEGHSRLYTIWLIGCYDGKTIGKPPDPPPVPPELME